VKDIQETPSERNIKFYHDVITISHSTCSTGKHHTKNIGKKGMKIDSTFGDTNRKAEDSGAKFELKGGFHS
jgi:hypothetical protein